VFFALRFHLVLVTKHRRKAITKDRFFKADPQGFQQAFEPHLPEACILASLLLLDQYRRGDYRNTAEVHRRAG
jgi:hypothetical protein